MLTRSIKDKLIHDDHSSCQQVCLLLDAGEVAGEKLHVKAMQTDREVMVLELLVGIWAQTLMDGQAFGIAVDTDTNERR